MSVTARAEKKLATPRLGVLKLAEILGNSSAACRQRGMPRSQFYEFKRRFQTHGLEGLQDLPPIHKTHPQTTPPEVVAQLLALSTEHPMWGCTRLSHQLKLQGRYVSSPIVQKILIKHGLGSRYPHTAKLPEHAAAVLHNDALPQYKKWGLKVGAVLTDNGREFCGTDAQPFELYLALNGIEHRRTKVRSPRTNGFVERFNRTVLDEFFREAFRKKYYASVRALRQDLDRWLKFYNEERSHQGYRNQGRRPLDTVRRFVKVLGKKVG
jgi:hypothetical protein